MTQAPAHGPLYSKNGFSLMELSLGFVVCSIVLLTLLHTGKGFIDHAKIGRDQTKLTTIAQACREYYQKEGHWPEKVSDLQPFFLSSEANFSNVLLSSKDNIIQISYLSNSITTVRPRGLTTSLDYK